MQTNLDVIRKYLSLLERFSDSMTEFSEVLDPHFEQKEYPNILNKNGQESDFLDAIRRASMGKKMMSRQSFEILNSIENGAHLAVEVLWTGTMAVDAGPLKAHQILSANFCFVCEFKNGRIFRQRNYDCRGLPKPARFTASGIAAGMFVHAFGQRKSHLARSRACTGALCARMRAQFSKKSDVKFLNYFSLKLIERTN